MVDTTTTDYVNESDSEYNYKLLTQSSNSGGGGIYFVVQ